MNERALLAATSDLSRVFPDRVVQAGGARRYAADFGRQVRRPPALIVSVRSESDIVAALEIATRYHLPCRVRGAGHSCGGQTLVEGGLILLNAARTAEPVVLHDGEFLETSSRNRWAWVERGARARGRAIPVLGDWPSLTVGGTLSVGGYGVGSLRWGGQIDHVARIRLVLPNGRAVWCSPTEQSELFRYSLAGLGALGVIERAVIRTVPRAGWLSLRTYRAADLAAVADAARALHGWRGAWPEVFYYTGKRARFVVGTAAPTFERARCTAPAPVFARFRQTSHIVLPNLPALAQIGVAAWLAKFPNHLRVWSDFVLPADTLPQFLDYVAEARRDRTFAQQLRTIYVLGIRAPVHATSLPLAPAGDPPPALAFGVGLYCMVSKRTDRITAVRAALRGCLERCIELGGRPYMYGWHELDAELLARAFGSSLGCLSALRREHDPHGLFNSVFEAA